MDRANVVESRILIRVSHSKLFNKVLQCPTLLNAYSEEISFFVASRDKSNRSNIFFVTTGIDGQIESERIRIEVALSPEDLNDDCLGVLPGTIYETNSQEKWLIGNAFFRIPFFHSRLFKVKISNNCLGEVIKSSLEFINFDSETDSRFRTTPSIYKKDSVTKLIYSATFDYPAGYQNPDFPEGYGIFWAEVSDELKVTGDERKLYWEQDGSSEALASPRQDPINSSRIWFAKRKVESDSYNINSIQLEEDLKPNMKMLSDHKQKYFSKSRTERAYPFLFQFHNRTAFLCSLGKFGDAGIELLQI